MGTASFSGILFFLAATVAFETKEFNIRLQESLKPQSKKCTKNAMKHLSNRALPKDGFPVEIYEEWIGRHEKDLIRIMNRHFRPRKQSSTVIPVCATREWNVVKLYEGREGELPSYFGTSSDVICIVPRMAVNDTAVQFVVSSGVWCNMKGVAGTQAQQRLAANSANAVTAAVPPTGAPPASTPLPATQNLKIAPRRAAVVRKSGSRTKRPRSRGKSRRRKPARRKATRKPTRRGRRAKGRKGRGRRG